MTIGKFDYVVPTFLCFTFFITFMCINSIHFSTKHSAFVTQKIQSSKLKMSLTSLPCVLWCKVSRVQKWISSEMIFSFTCFLAYNISNNINWNELLNVFHRLPASRWEIVLPRHKGQGASFTTEKCKQLTFISVWIMRWTTQKLLLRWDFFRCYNTRNWACFSWFGQAIEGHHSSFPFWFKYPKKDTHPAIELLIVKSISNSCMV